MFLKYIKRTLKLKNVEIINQDLKDFLKVKFLLFDIVVMKFALNPIYVLDFIPKILKKGGSFIFSERKDYPYTEIILEKVKSIKLSLKREILNDTLFFVIKR